MHEYEYEKMHGMNTNTKKCTENRNHVVNSLVHCPIHLLLSTGIIDDRNIPGKVLVSRDQVRMRLVFVFFYARTRIRKIEILSSTHHCRIHLLSSISSRLNLSWTRHRIAPFGPIRGTTIWRQRDELLPKLCLSLNFN